MTGAWISTHCHHELSSPRVGGFLYELLHPYQFRGVCGFGSSEASRVGIFQVSRGLAASAWLDVTSQSLDHERVFKGGGNVSTLQQDLNKHNRDAGTLEGLNYATEKCMT